MDIIKRKMNSNNFEDICRRYSFLRKLMRNKEISSINEIECDELPPPQHDYSYCGTDWCFWNTHFFEDSENLYRVLDEDFQVDYDDDKPISSVHTLNVYIKRKRGGEEPRKRVVVFSGPSGVGKGPIIDWVRKLYVPGLCQVKVRKTKTERHKGNEDDLGFEGCDGEYYSFDCRGIEQRIYLDELDSVIEGNAIILLEVYYKALDFLKDRYGGLVDFASTFVSPLGVKEIRELTGQGEKIENYLPDVMLDSLVRRAERDGKVFTCPLVQELEQRAEDSVNEMKFASDYRHVIPNHCYESDSRWKSGILIGEPKRVVDSLHEILQTGNSDYADKGTEYLDII